jgi:SEC-C motif-containing protein
VTCPCGGLPPGTPYDACCAPLHRQERYAETPEHLMRSRYSAFALHDADHLFRTWHPRTRPDDVTAPVLHWTGLEIVDAPEPVADRAEVEFVASYAGGRLHERSRFERRRGRWLYVDGDAR